MRMPNFDKRLLMVTAGASSFLHQLGGVWRTIADDCANIGNVETLSMSNSYQNLNRNSSMIESDTNNNSNNKSKLNRLTT